MQHSNRQPACVPSRSRPSATIKIIMLATAFISWWYGPGWKLVASRAAQRLDKTLASFSVPTLAKTLFSPWKRVVSAPGAGISDHFRASIDNTVSRFVGFGVRLTVLLAACVTWLAIGIFGLVQLVLWPLVPPLIIICLVKGVL